MSPQHPLERVLCKCGDITREAVDAVVNAANSSLRGGGGVDGALHRAAGPGLLAECIARHPEGCPTGEARITGGHGLPARHVIHAVGPIWTGGARGEDAVLAGCYRSALRLASEAGLASLAFPAISCGVYGYPHERAAEVAMAALAEGLRAAAGIREVRMVLFTDSLFRIFQAALERARADP